MVCPFCSAVNPPNSSACRTCGGPLRAQKPTPAPKPAVQLIQNTPKPVHLGNKVWDEKTPGILAVGFHPDDENILFLALENSCVLFWDRQSDEVQRWPEGHRFSKSGPICNVALASPRGDIVFGYETGEVRWHNVLHAPKRGLWKRSGDVTAGEHLGCVLALVTTPTHLYSGGSDGVILVTPLPVTEQKNRGSLESQILQDGLGAMSTLAVSSDSQLLAWGCDDGRVQLWRLTAEGTQAELDWTSRKQRKRIESLTFSPNANMLLSRDAEDGLCLLASRTGYELPLAPEARISLIPPVFAADSRLLAIANPEKGVSIFDAWTGQLSFTLPSTGQNLRVLAFAPVMEPDATETRLVVAGSGEIAVWQVPL